MDMMSSNFMPGDPVLVDKIVYELKSQGIFDQFRKECISDVDTRPAYQNLRQRVEGSVTGFLRKQTWQPDMNKNQVRELLRKNIQESGFLETGVERIVDQVVNPKINSIFLAKVTEVVYKFLGIEKPKEEYKPNVLEKLEVKTENLLPTDLEAVSPDSVASEKKVEKNMDSNSLNDSKIDDDESPPFEPIDQPFQPTEENSVDSHMSGFSGLISHDSNYSQVKQSEMDISYQDTKMSFDGHLSIVVSEDNDSKMEICDDSQSKSGDIIVKHFEFNADSSDKSSSSYKFEKKEDKKDEKRDSIKTEKDESKKEKDDKKEKDERRGRDEKREKDKRDDRKRDKDKRDRSRERTKSEDQSKYDKHKSRSESNKDKKDDKRTDKDKYKSSSKDSKERDKSRDNKDKKDSSYSKNKNEKDKDRSERDKGRSEKDRERSERDIEKSERDKEKGEKEKEKSEKDKERSDKDKERNERDKDRSDKDKERSDKDRKSSSSKYSGSSRDKSSSSSRKESSSSSKDKSKSSSSSSNKDVKKDDKSKGDYKSSSKSDSKHSSSNSSKRDERKSSSSKKDGHTRDKDKREYKIKKDDTKDDHFSLKGKRSDRRSTDRDSNDGHSGHRSSSASLSESTASSQNQSKSQDFIDSTNSGSTDSGGNSEAVENDSGNCELSKIYEDKCPREQMIKWIKPKVASNIHEARKLMKIRKKLQKLERQGMYGEHVNDESFKENKHKNIMSQQKVAKDLLVPDQINLKANDAQSTEESKESSSHVVPSPPLKSAVVSAASWDEIEAQLNKNIDYNTYVDYTEYEEVSLTKAEHIEVNSKPEDGELSVSDCTKKKDENECCYLLPHPIEEISRYQAAIKKIRSKLESDIKKTSLIISSAKTPARYPRSMKNDMSPPNTDDSIHSEHSDVDSRGTKRKLCLEEQSDVHNNNKRNNYQTEVENHVDKFPLPLSPAESEKSIDVKVRRNNCIVKGSSQRYSSDDLYKPRPSVRGSRRRGKNLLD